MIVSTVFLVIDHNFFNSDNVPPILFETLVIGGVLDGEGERYSTWDEAKEGHLKWVELVTMAEVSRERGGLDDL